MLEKIDKNIQKYGMNILEDINTDIKLIRKFNIFSHHNMSYPLLNFCKDTDKLDFLTHNINFGNFYFKIDLKKVKYSPRFFHYHEIALFYFFKQVNGKLKGCEKKLYKSDFTRFLKNRYKKFNSLKICNNLPYIEDKTFIINSDDKTEIKDNLKIAIVSIKVESDDIEKSYTTKPNLLYKRLQNIFDILNESLKKKEHKPDLIVFPEVSIPYAWIHLMARFAKKNNIGIVFGVEHIKIDKLVSNYTCIMLPFKTDSHTNLFINFDLKRHYSPVEQMGIEGIGLKVNENKKVKQTAPPVLYKWRGSVFTTFNCFELTDVTLRSTLVGKVDFIVAIEYNKDINYFSNIIESTSRDVHCYVVQVNTSDYGDSRILQPTKTASKDIIKIKGGENLYLAVNDIDIKKLRKFQMKNHCLQKQVKEKDSFKLTPPKFEISQFRKI